MDIMNQVRPGGEISSRPLHFFWVADCSGSMAGEKISQLNFAIRNAIPEMRSAAEENPHGKLFVRVLKFSTGAEWVIEDPVSVDDFQWRDLTAGGVTNLGLALTMISEQLKMPPMEERALPPVIVLLTDGMPTDDYRKGLDKILNLPWGKKAVKIAISIGNDTDVSILREFMNNPELEPLQANNAPELIQYIKWVSTAVIKAVSSPSSRTEEDREDRMERIEAGQEVSNIDIPQIPEVIESTSDDDISVDDAW